MNNEQTPAIEFRNVSISFDDVQALRNVSFTLPPGEMICVTGDSDSGKSVLLRLALGFLRPDEGRIFINGRETTVMEEDDLLALRRETMGMVFQDNSFFSGQTVYENTAYRLDDRGWPEDEIERAVVEILTFVGLEKIRRNRRKTFGRNETPAGAGARAGRLAFDHAARRADGGLDPINARHVLDLIIRARSASHLRCWSPRRFTKSRTSPDTRRVKTRRAVMWNRSPVMSPAFRSARSKKAESPSSGVRRNSRKARCPRFNTCFTR